MSALMPIESVRFVKTNNISEIKGDSSMAANNSRKAAVSIKPANQKGLDFARHAMMLGAARGNIPGALAIAQDRYPANDNLIGALKGAVAAGSTTNPTFGASLVQQRNINTDFLEFLSPQTIIGQLKNLRKVDFNVNVPRQTIAGSAAWVKEGHSKPVTGFGLDVVNLKHNKIAAISVATMELLRFSTPAAETLIRDGLAAAVIERLDDTLMNPAVAAVEDTSPASLLHGVVSPVISSGSDSDAIRNDVRRIVGKFIAGNHSIKNAVWIMPTAIAFALSIAVTPLGEPEFKGMSIDSDAVFYGRPVIVSDYIPADLVALIDPTSIFIADDGEVTIDSSHEASLQMDSEPTQSSTVPTATTSVSMFATNSVAFRAERYVTFEKGRATAAQFISNVSWASEYIGS